MMTELQPNLTTYLHALDAFNRDDLDAVRNHVRAGRRLPDPRSQHHRR